MKQKKQKIIRTIVAEYPETHMRGNIQFSNYKVDQTGEYYTNITSAMNPMGKKCCDFGIQIAEDGRVWICIDGVSFLRFKPIIKIEKEGK